MGALCLQTVLLCVCVCGQKACREVEESERAVEALQLEVSALRKSLREKQQSSAGKVAGKIQIHLQVLQLQSSPHAVCFHRNQQPS